MSRHPHAPTPLEILRVLAEHVVGIGMLFGGLVVGAWLRDDRIPSLLSPGAWLPPGAVGRYLVPFVIRLGRFRPDLGGYLAWNVLATAALQYSMYLHGLYDRQGVRRSRNVLLRLARSALVAGVGLAVVFFVVRPPELGRIALVFGYALSVLAFWAADHVRREIFAPRPERLLLLGEGPACREAARAAAEAAPPGFRVLGRLGAPAGEQGVPRLGGWEDLPALLAREPVDRLLLAAPPPPEWDLAPMTAARLSGAAVESAREFAEGLTGQVLEDGLGPEFIINATSRAYGAVSRTADVLLSLACLAVLALPLAAAGLAILLASGPPVLFRQERVGRGGRTFSCLKLRTMRADAEKDGPAWSPENDPRRTAVGRFLRRWRIDELPQLLNVLAGDMAFVGPRPEQPFFVERLSRSVPHYGLRHLVRPGITGWAQIRHPYGATEDEARSKLRYDLFYVKHRSPYLDLAILFDTVRVVLRGQGR